MIRKQQRDTKAAAAAAAVRRMEFVCRDYIPVRDIILLLFLVRCEGQRVKRQRCQKRWMDDGQENTACFCMPVLVRLAFVAFTSINSY